MLRGDCWYIYINILYRWPCPLSRVQWEFPYQQSPRNNDHPWARSPGIMQRCLLRLNITLYQHCELYYDTLIEQLIIAVANISCWIRYTLMTRSYIAINEYIAIPIPLLYICRKKNWIKVWLHLVTSLSPICISEVLVVRVNIDTIQTQMTWTDFSS